LKRVQRAVSYKNTSIPPTSSADELYGHKQQSFPPSKSPKMRESQQLFFGFRTRADYLKNSKIQHSNQNSAALWWIFSSVYQPVGRKDSIQAVCRRMRRKSHFCIIGSELLTLQDPNKKIKKPIEVDVLSKAYPMILFSCKSNLAAGTFEFCFN
jgi:hypothetical protein